MRRNEADATLQLAIAQHAAQCKNTLASSTADIELQMGKITSNNVMQLEEEDVHKASALLSCCLSTTLKAQCCIACEMHQIGTSIGCLMCTYCNVQHIVL